MITIYLLLGVGIAFTNMFNWSEEEKKQYDQLKKNSPGSLLIGFMLVFIFWLPIIIYGLLFSKKRE